MKDRKGFALIYTVLISALVLISIVGLTMKIIPEKAVTNARTHSQRALLTAEAGASQVLFDLRNFGTDTDVKNDFDPDSGSIHYLSKDDVINLIESTGGVYPYSEHIFESGSGYSTTYQAKIKVNNNDITNKILDVDLYVLGTVKDGSGSQIFAREAIKTGFEVIYNVEVKDSNSGIFNYALLFWK